MWQLFGDQLNRNRSVAITFAAILLVVPLLSALLPLLDIQGKGILYFFFFWMLFWAGFVGVGNTMADRKGLRVMRALPVRSRDTAWASWLGATAPGVLIGVVACGALPVLDAVPGFATEFPVALDQLIGLGAVTVVWACGLAGIAWGLMMVVARHDPRPAIGVGAFLFIVAYIAVLAPIWVGAVAPGWSLRDAFEAEQAVLLFVVVGLALGSFALSPRLLSYTSRSPARLLSRAAGTRDERRRRGGHHTAAVAEALRVFGLAMAATLGGFLVASVLPALGGSSFRIRHNFLLFLIIAVPGLWMTAWLPAARAFRCLPLSAGRLALLPVGYATVLSLAGAGAVVVVMGLAGQPPGVITPMHSHLWWLLFCPGLLSLFYSRALCADPGRRVGTWLRSWTAVVVVGSLSDLLSNFGTFRGWSDLSGPFWLGAIGGLVLALLGYLTLRRSLGTESTPYRSMSPARQW